MDKEDKEFAKRRLKARMHYRKYKETGSERHKRKADYNYALCDIMEIKAKHPSTNVSVKQTNINDSFKYSNQTTYGIHKPKVSTNLAKAKK